MVARQGARINVDCYSSVRPLCKYVKLKDESVSKLILYEHASQHEQGRSKTYNVDNPDFGGYNDIITNLNRNDFYSSAKPICSSYRKRSKCSIKRIEVIDDGKFKPQLVGTKVIASNSAASCYGPGSHELSIQYAESVELEESMTLEISEADGINWSDTASAEVEASAKIFGFGGKFTVGISATVGGPIQQLSQTPKASPRDQKRWLDTQLHIPFLGEP